MPATPFGETHRRHVLHAFLAIHRRLAELESLTSQGSRPSPFSQYVNDLSPTEVRVLLDHFARIRAVMLAHLEELSIPLEVRRTSVRWAFQTNLMQVQVGIDDMGPEQLKGYGQLDDSGRAVARRIQDDLTRLLDRTRSYLNQGLGRDLSERLARLDATSPGIESLATLDRIVTRWRLIEYRPTLDMIVTRLESPTYEVAVFGRVSTGKSSLLNHVVGMDVLPVGVTPVTAVPTRLEFGEKLTVLVSFAETRPCAIETERLWEYASEEGNPGNAKHVTGIHVTVPSPRLRSGVVFVDTPGVGSLAASGAAEALAYLPRCDLGIVLIDAASSLAPDDLALLRALYEAGAPAMVLLSKSDLLAPSDRQRMVDYIREQLGRELGLDLLVSPVSVVGADESLLARWFDSELEPLMGRHHELVTASLRRKIASVRESIAVTLETLNSRGQGGPRSSLIDPSEIRRLLDGADGAVRNAWERWQCLLTDRESLMGEILGAAAEVVITARGRSPGASNGWLANSVGDILGRRARAVHELVTRLRDELGKVLDGLRRFAPMTDAEVVSVREMKFDGLPLPDLEAFRFGWDGVCPWWTRLFPWSAGSVVENRIWGRFGRAIHDTVESYDRRLQTWSKATIEGLVEGFELQATLFREQVRRLGAGTLDDSEAGHEADELEADLRELRRGLTEGHEDNEHLTLPVAGELQPR